MIPIKLRAWNAKQKIMEQVCSINLFHNEIITSKEVYAEDGSYTIEYNTLFGFKNEFELIQFTGLKDKNGNDIYDGDVLKLHGCFESAVYFKDGSWCIIGVANSKIREELLFNVLDTCEIAGNIHENAELFKKQLQETQ